MLHPFWRSFTIAAAIGASLGCSSEPGDIEPLASAPSPIFGGQLATTCQWPTTVLLNGCTGTLVHPLIVTTAGHCGTNHRTATFGETRTSPGARTVNIQSCSVYNGPRIAGHLTDWAFCKLATPVTDVPIVPILMGCETDILKPGQKVVVAGFGDNTDNGTGFGTKRWVETTVNREDTGRGIQVGGMGKAPCFGDSGGPAFVKLADGSWRVFGVDSSGTGSSCGAGDLMGLIHPAVPWIEQTSGVDVTPCHDADGTWNPSASCTGFSLAPDSTGRTWDNGCAEPITSGREATCGPPFGGDGGAFDAGARDAADHDTGARDARIDVTGTGGAGGAPPDAAGGRGGSGGAGGTAGAAGDGAGGGGGSAGGGGGGVSTGGSGGASGSGTAGKGPGAGGSHTSSTSTGNPPRTQPEETGGCSCRTARAPSPNHFALAMLALASLGVRRRQRATSSSRRWR
jgi:MYXO-CTERM domain-containing protein